MEAYQVFLLYMICSRVLIMVISMFDRMMTVGEVMMNCLPGFGEFYLLRLIPLDIADLLEVLIDVLSALLTSFTDKE